MVSTIIDKKKKGTFIRTLSFEVVRYIRSETK